MSNNEVLIKVENVSKKFCRSLKRSLWYGMKDLASEFLRRNGYRDLRQDEFWALDDISFELRSGQTLGVIGINGAGKTTMLRILNGLIKPDRGKITIRGRVGALIALGAGFNPILTGRENIYINATVLGFSKRQVDGILNDIIEYADIGDFIDTPVQNYSSGMRVRLGFAVAAHLNPDIFLIDEVLAVGDFAFREKSFARVIRLCKSGAGVVFVSHNMAAILTICDRVLWLDHGKVHMFGPAEDVVKAYLESQEEIANQQVQKESERTRQKGDETLQDQMRIKKIELLNQEGQVTTRFRSGDNLLVRIHYVASRPIKEPHFVVHVKTAREIIFVADMLRDGIAPPMVEGEGVLECVFRHIPLLANRYIVGVLVFGKTPIIKIVFPAKQVFFTVQSDTDEQSSTAISLVRNPGLLPVVNEWCW